MFALLRAWLEYGTGAIAVLVAVMAFASMLAFVLRAFGDGSGGRARYSRARIEAELERREQSRRDWARYAAPRTAERTLRRRLAAVEAVLLTSSFPGERDAAAKARERLTRQLLDLTTMAGPDADPVLTPDRTAAAPPIPPVADDPPR